MARLHDLRDNPVYRVSSELLGRTKLQQVSTSPTPPPSVPRPTRSRRPKLPHKASIRDYV